MSEEPVIYQLPENTSREVRKMVIGLCIFVGVVFLIGGLVFANAHRIARHIPFSAEQKFVEPYGALIGPHTRQSNNPQMDAYLQEIADKLSQTMDLPEDMKITVHYVDSNLQNAMATLGGHVFIFRGLIDMMPDENSLAMVVAHEVSHIEKRDPVASLGRGFAMALIYSFVMQDGSSAGQVSELGAEVGLSVFSRKQEKAADIAAIDALVGVYGHARGYDHFFAKMRKQMQDDDEFEYPEWMSSHPDLQKRLDYLKAHIVEQEYKIGEATPLALPVLHNEFVAPHFRKKDKDGK